MIINKINDYYTISDRAYIHADVTMDGKERKAIIILPVTEISAFELRLIEGK